MKPSNLTFWPTFSTADHCLTIILIYGQIKNWCVYISNGRYGFYLFIYFFFFSTQMRIFLTKCHKILLFSIMANYDSETEMNYINRQFSANTSILKLNDTHQSCYIFFSPTQNVIKFYWWVRVFTSLSTVFQSYRNDGRVTMKCSVQWSTL